MDVDRPGFKRGGARGGLSRNAQGKAGQACMRPRPLQRAPVRLYGVGRDDGMKIAGANLNREHIDAGPDQPRRDIRRERPIAEARLFVGSRGIGIGGHFRIERAFRQVAAHHLLAIDEDASAAGVDESQRKPLWGIEREGDAIEGLLKAQIDGLAVLAEGCAADAGRPAAPETAGAAAPRPSHRNPARSSLAAAEERPPAQTQRGCPARHARANPRAPG